MIAGPNALTLTNATVFDGAGEPQRGAFVEIRDGTITALGPTAAQPVSGTAPVVDLGGRFVMPGLIDCHVHLCHTLARVDQWGPPAGRWLSEEERLLVGVIQAAEAVRNGITTVRDLGCSTTGIFALAQLTSSGALPGPNILAAGRIICMTGGHGYRTGRECDGPDDARKAAREQIKAGARWLKVAATGGARSPNESPRSVQLGEDEMSAVVREAGNAGLSVACHAHGTGGIRAAIRAGVKTIEHGVFLDDETVTMMKAREVSMVPTLAVYHALVERGEKFGAEGYACEKARGILEPHRASFQRAVAAGVSIIVGTDSGGPYQPIGASIVSELEAMHEAGMSREEVLRAATRDAAEVLGVADQVGTLQPGRRADLLIVEGDPLADLSCLRAVAGVLRDGRVVRSSVPGLGEESVQPRGAV